MKKLYVVTLEVSAVVYAEDELEACRIGADAVKEEIGHYYASDVDVVEYKNSLPTSWDADCLVYHADQYNMDITVKEAMGGIK